MKVKLYPTPNQKVLLNKMFGSHRAIYNKLVESSKDDCYRLSLKDLNNKYRPISQKHSLTNYLSDYHLEIPEEVMDSTYRDFTKALQSSRALFKVLNEKGEKTTFPTLSFKSKKDNTSSIEIRARTIKLIDDGIRFFPTYFGFEKTKGITINESISEINYSVRLQRTREGKYYLCIPKNKEFKQTNSIRTCAIDPGVRSFITIYDPQGITLSIDDTKDYIFKRCLLVDRLKSKLSKELIKRNRYRLRKLIYRMNQKIKLMISDMHQKTSKWLSDNYNEVLLPSFNTSNMTSKQKRISNTTSRKMLTWSHYKFKKLLEYKMERSGGRLIECQEHYTTKTCSQCGIINHNITKQKVFVCSHCNLNMDRDVNAARNIFLKNEHLLSWNLRFQVSEMPTPRLSGRNQ